MSLSLVAPIFALVIWSLAVLLWMMALRGKAMENAGITPASFTGGRGQDLEGRVPPHAQWPAHNYVHLMEQPTLFYAVALSLTVAGLTDGINVALAWAYVVLRIMHSIWQGRVNTIPMRATLFILSTGVLAALAIRGMIALL